MPEALAPALDLAAITACLLAIACLKGLNAILKPLVGIMDFSIDIGVTSFKPLGWLAHAITSYIIAGADQAIEGLQVAVAKLWYGLKLAFHEIIALAHQVGETARDAILYAYHHAIPGLIADALTPVKTEAKKLAKDIDSLDTRLVNEVKAARTYTNAAVRNAEIELRTEATAQVVAATAAAERYADQAVGKLKAAEDKAIGDAKTLVLEELHTDNTRIDAAIAAVQGIAVGSADDLLTVEGKFGALGTAGLIAAIPAIATLTHAIATEAGLDSQACRGKVKGICGTNPLAWAQLLAGLAAIGLAFSLEDLARLAEELAGGLSAVIKEAA